MRRKVPKVKAQQSVAIPQRLVQFLKYANELIFSGDEAAITPSDDLIQIVEFRGYLLAYGGLKEEGGSQFEFGYFTEPKQTDKKWEFELSREQIAEIAKNRLTHLTLWACTSPDCGCKFQRADDTCFECDYEETPTP
ncbi:MAG TPA: hypothetical protein VGO67_15975 [Verrucomicrobiae bacterium]|jgi:hypothetical protein